MSTSVAVDGNGAFKVRFLTNFVTKIDSDFVIEAEGDFITKIESDFIIEEASGSMYRELISAVFLLIVLFSSVPLTASGLQGESQPQPLLPESVPIEEIILDTIKHTGQSAIIAYGPGQVLVPSAIRHGHVTMGISAKVEFAARMGGLEVVRKGSVFIVTRSEMGALIREPVATVEYTTDTGDLLGHTGDLLGHTGDLLDIIRACEHLYNGMGMEFSTSSKDDILVFTVSASGAPLLERFLSKVKTGMDVTAAAAAVFPGKDNFVTVNLERTDLSTVVRLLCRQVGVNYVSTVPLAGQITVAIKDVHYLRALSVVLGIHGYGLTEIQNGILVEPFSSDNKQSR